jgi:hypothetical protein
MRTHGPRALSALLLGLLLAKAASAGTPVSGTEIMLDGGVEAAETRRALLAAVAMLPKSPERIAVMDVTGASGQVRAHLLTLDAFIVRGNAWIYVVQQSELLRRARSGSSVYVAMLATVLWHEMAHQGGADERGARKAEEELWARFLRDGVTDALTGLRYLQALRRRPDDQMPALAGNPYQPAAWPSFR